MSASVFNSATAFGIESQWIKRERYEDMCTE